MPLCAHRTRLHRRTNLQAIIRASTIHNRTRARHHTSALFFFRENNFKFSTEEERLRAARTRQMPTSNSTESEQKERIDRIRACVWVCMMWTSICVTEKSQVFNLQASSQMERKKIEPSGWRTKTENAILCKNEIVNNNKICRSECQTITSMPTDRKRNIHIAHAHAYVRHTTATHRSERRTRFLALLPSSTACVFFFSVAFFFF